MEYPHDLVKVTVYRSDRQRLKALAARQGVLMHQSAGRAIALAETNQDAQEQAERDNPQLEPQLKGEQR